MQNAELNAECRICRPLHGAWLSAQPGSNARPSQCQGTIGEVDTLPETEEVGALLGAKIPTVDGTVEVETLLPGLVRVTELPMVVMETEPLTLEVGATEIAPGGRGGVGTAAALAALGTGSDTTGSGTSPTAPSETTRSLFMATDSFPSAA